MEKIFMGLYLNIEAVFSQQKWLLSMNFFRIRSAPLFTNSNTSTIIKAMRIFAGIQLAEAVRERIAAELTPFKAIANSIRWTESRNIHLTLKFIGEVAPAKTELIKEALRSAKAHTSPFPLQIRGFGKFPAGDDLHIFWAGIDDSPQLQELFSVIEAALAPLGVARETRPFSPHITLGRNKARYNFKTLFELLAARQDVSLAEFTVSSYQLFSSQLTPRGPLYSVLMEIPLDPS
jgi:2'-5' RNA ligase